MEEGACAVWVRATLYASTSDAGTSPLPRGLRACIQTGALTNSLFRLLTARNGGQCLLCQVLAVPWEKALPTQGSSLNSPLEWPSPNGADTRAVAAQPSVAKRRRAEKKTSERLR